MASPDLSILELESIEREIGIGLDDDSFQLLGPVRALNLIRDEEWNQVKGYLRESLQFLRAPEMMATRDAAGALVIDPDVDPRNADWLRIATANRMAGHVLPIWAALWLWWLKTDTSRTFWRRVGEIAAELGYAAYDAGEAK